MQKGLFYYLFAMSSVDFFLLNASFLFMVIAVKGHGSLLSFGRSYFLLGLFMNLTWLFCIMTGNRLTGGDHEGLLHNLAVNTVKVFLLTVTLSMLAFSAKELKLSRIAVYGTVALFFFLQSGFYILARNYVWRIVKGRMKRNNILIAGAGEAGREIKAGLEAGWFQAPCNFCGFLDDRGGPDVTGGIFDAKREIERCNADEIIIALSSDKTEAIGSLVEMADFYGVRVRIAFNPVPAGDISKIRHIGRIPVAYIRGTPLDSYRNALKKRLFDIIFSLVCLIILFPLFLLIALIIKTVSPGPVFYRPERTKSQGGRFRLYKFRTMIHADESPAGPVRKCDERVFPFGRMLRKLNLDELPQFYNVLRGDMSVVGPRPHRAELDKIFQDRVKYYMLRYYVKPGITGWAQVNGWRGPTDTQEKRINRVECDLWYINNWNFWLDLKIILLTIFSRKSWQNAF